MSVAHIMWFTLVALFFSNPSIRSSIIGYRHWLEKVFGAALTLFGLSLAYSTLGQR
jgi:threonine/homoserine/homoserine lactone efflux protein